MRGFIPLVSPVTLFLLVIIMSEVDGAGSFYGVKPFSISFDLLYLLAWYALLRLLLPVILAYLLLFIVYPYKICRFCWYCYCVCLIFLFDSLMFGRIPLFIFTPTMLNSPPSLFNSEFAYSPANGNINEPLRRHFWFALIGVCTFLLNQKLLLLDYFYWYYDQL